MKELELLLPFEQRPPGPVTVVIISKMAKRRQVYASDIEVEKGSCVWCNVSPLPPRKLRWCSVECIRSYHHYCRPQSQAVKMWVLIQRQSFACVGCGESYEDRVRKSIIRASQKSPLDWIGKPVEELNPGPKKVSYWEICQELGSELHLDHVHPIFKGGDGIGLHNIQVLCVKCHKIKTAEERRL